MNTIGLTLSIVLLCLAFLIHEGLREREVYERETVLTDAVIWGSTAYGALLFVALFFECMPTYSGRYVIVPDIAWVFVKTLFGLLFWSIPLAWELGGKRHQKWVRRLVVGGLVLFAMASGSASTPFENQSSHRIETYVALTLPVSNPNVQIKKRVQPEQGVY